MTSNDMRLQQLTAWANGECARLAHFSPNAAKTQVALETVSGDASFRRYFRLRADECSYIVVDAPPAHENNAQFVQIAELFRGAQVSTPRIFAVDYRNGFMLLEDFGDTLYLQPLLLAQAETDLAQADRLYQQAISALVKIQQHVDASHLPVYTQARLHDEMGLFETWFCEALLELPLAESERDCIGRGFAFLEDAALSQPQVAVHRDYHSRNLLVLNRAQYDAGKNPGIIDFQDAVAGAYTYDLVSLLRDCYISWDDVTLRRWMDVYFAQAQHANLLPAVSTTQFYRDFDLMGLQRNLKVMGIFSRLALRDQKPRYLADIPLVVRYFLNVSSGYEELAAFRHWFRQVVIPAARLRLAGQNF